MWEIIVMGRSKLRKTDYNNVNLSLFQLLGVAIKGIIIIGGISYIFYKSIIAFAIFLPVLIVYVRMEIIRKKVERKKLLQSQFKDGIILLLSSLEAGYSVENAFEDVCGQLRQMYRKPTDIEREFQIICKGLRLNEPIEAVLNDFANRSHLEDIKNFAEVFMIAKKRGGNMIMILKSSINTIREKLEVEQEIQTLLSGKRLEHNIMSVVPVGIILYVNFTSPEFMEAMYHNLAGIIVMSGCLLVYIFSVLLGRRIVEVEI